MHVVLACALLVCLAGPALTETPPTASLADEAPKPSRFVAQSAGGHVVSIREVTLKPGIDPDEFERFVVDEFNPTFEASVPGVRAFILKGIRGDRTEGYAFVLVFDSEHTRNFYFPTEHVGEANTEEPALTLWAPGDEMIRARLMQYVDGISETEGYTDYVPVSSGTQPAIDTGHIVAVREIALKPEVDPAEFERFAEEELTPTFDRYVPGVKSFIMQGDRGDRTGGYVFLLIFDSVNTRNFFFPTEESTEFNMPEEALSLWHPGQRVLLDRLLGFVVELGGGATEVPTGGFTDYVVVG